MARRTSLVGGGSRALRALCQRALSSADFRAALRAPLRASIAFDAYCANTCDVDTGVVTSSVGDGLSSEQARLLFALEAEGSDFNGLRDLHRGPKRLATMWQSTGGELERSPRMRRIFMPLGFIDELRAALAIDGACFGYLHLFRRSELGPFRAAELKQLATLTPLLGASLRRAAASEAADSSNGESSSPGLLVLDAHNRLVQHSDHAPAAVAGLDRLRVDSGAAHVLHDLVSRARAGAESRATLVRAGARARCLSAVQLAAHTAVIVDASTVEASRTLLAISAGLTARERKVSACVARGDENLGIAAELGISLHTVKDHIKAILNKTGCANRTELAARWNGARS